MVANAGAAALADAVRDNGFDVWFGIQRAWFPMLLRGQERRAGVSDLLLDVRWRQFAVLCHMKEMLSCARCCLWAWSCRSCLSHCNLLGCGPQFVARCEDRGVMCTLFKLRALRNVSMPAVVKFT